MNRLHVTTCAVAALAIGSVAPAWAQGPAPARFGGIGSPGLNQPVYSPYLNLLRTNNSTLQNYYGLVRPEIQFRNAATTLQNEVLLNQQNIGYLEAQNASANAQIVTGHGAYFLNTQGYFLRGTGGGGGARGAGLGSARGAAGGGFTVPPGGGFNNRPGMASPVPGTGTGR